MADNKAKIEMTASDESVLRALQKVDRAFDKVADKLQRIEKASERATGKTKAGFSDVGKTIQNAATQLVGFGSAMGGIGALVMTIKNEMAELRRRDSEARVAQRSAAEAVRAARVNFVADASLKDADLETALQGVAARTRTPVGTVSAAFSSAASAKGSLTNQDALKAVEAAFTLSPGDLATGVELGSRSLDIAKLKQGISPRAAVGFLQNLQSASRVTELSRLGGSAPAAISAAVSAGDTPEQAAEMFAAFSNLLADAQGNISGTALKNFSSQLSGFVPGASGTDARGKFKVPAAAMAAFEAAQGPTARLGVLQQNPELRRDFMARNSFAAESRVAVERLLSGEAGAMRELNIARQIINPLDMAQERAFGAKVAQLEGGQFQPVLSAEQGTAGVAERARLRNSTGARRAAARQALENALDLVGDNAPNQLRRLTTFDYTAGDQPEQAAIDVLRSDLRRIQDFLQNTDAAIRPNDADVKDAREDSIVLKEQLKVLQDLRDDSRRRDPPAQRRQPAAQALGRRQ